MRSHHRLLLATVSIMVTVLSLSLTWWLMQTHSLSPINAIQLYTQLSKRTSAPPGGFTNGLANDVDQQFHIRQHGSHWIVYNYIKAGKRFKGNDSVTLVLQSEWMELENLPMLLKSWNGPISLTLFANGADFGRAREYLSYLSHCTIYGHGLHSYVTINLLMHQDYIPYFIPHTEKLFFMKPSSCFQAPKLDFLQNYRLKRNLSYPINLARNIARQTATTYYVLTMDMSFVPSSGIPSLFMEMQRFAIVGRPKKTVFVLPLFEINYSDIIPARKSDLRILYNRTLAEFLNSKSPYKIPHLTKWLEAEEKSNMDTWDRIKREGQWLAWYISVNDYEPLADERYTKESRIDRVVQLDLLETLDYDFHVLDNAFLLRRITLTNFYQPQVPRQEKEIILYQQKLMIMKNFLMNFM